MSRPLNVRVEEAKRKIEHWTSRVSGHAKQAHRHRSEGEDLQAAQSDKQQGEAMKALLHWKAVLKELYREGHKEAAEREKRKNRMGGANVTWDDRTALADRIYDVVSLGGSLRASVNHMNRCLKNRYDRTDARILAWQKVDQHHGTLHSGAIPSPSFEPAVDSSSMGGVGFAMGMLGANTLDDDMRQSIGAPSHNLLRHVVYMQRPLAEISIEWGVPEAELEEQLKQALDLAACYFRVGERVEEAREASRRIEPRGRRQRR